MAELKLYKLPRIPSFPELQAEAQRPVRTGRHAPIASPAPSLIEEACSEPMLSLPTTSFTPHARCGRVAPAPSLSALDGDEAFNHFFEGDDDGYDIRRDGHITL